MITPDMLFTRMMTADVLTVRGAIRRWAMAMVHQRKSARAILESDGWEVVDVTDDAMVTPDGRPINRNAGVPMALRPDVLAERLARQFEAARQRQAEQATKEPETNSVVGTESLSQMVCPKCGDSLQHTSVCPKCSAGQRGYKHRYACVCGAVEIISQEAL